MAGLCAPLSTLRQYPRGYLRMTRGRCGSLLLHRDGLAPSTPCRSPGALRSTPLATELRTFQIGSFVPDSEAAFSHSITSSARRSRAGGIWMPKDRAVAELMTNSNAVG